MKRLIRFQVKFNFTLHIQLIFQLVRKRINWLLSNGTNLRQTLRPDFTAKPMMMMMKDAMLSHKADRDSIIPIHNIYSRFVPSKFVVGTRTPKTYMAVTSILNFQIGSGSDQLKIWTRLDPIRIWKKLSRDLPVRSQRSFFVG